MYGFAQGPRWKEPVSSSVPLMCWMSTQSGIFFKCRVMALSTPQAFENVHEGIELIDRLPVFGASTAAHRMFSHRWLQDAAKERTRASSCGGLFQQNGSCRRALTKRVHSTSRLHIFPLEAPTSINAECRLLLCHQAHHG